MNRIQEIWDEYWVLIVYAALGLATLLFRIRYFFDAEVGNFAFAVWLVFTVATLRNVPENDVWVISRFARFHILWEPSFHIMWPGMWVKKKLYTRETPIYVELTGQESGYDGRTRTLVDTTDDSFPLRFKFFTIVPYEIGKEYRRGKDNNPYLAAYEVKTPSYKLELITVMETAVRRYCGTRTLDQVVAEKESLAAFLKGPEFRKQFWRWGVQLIDVFIEDVDVPKASQEIRRQKLLGAATRDARVMIATGERDAAILAAEGEAKAGAKRGKGEGDRIRKTARVAGVTPGEVMGFELARDQNTALGRATVFLSSADSVLSIPAATAQAAATLDKVRKNVASGEETPDAGAASPTGEAPPVVPPTT